MHRWGWMHRVVLDRRTFRRQVQSLSLTGRRPPSALEAPLCWWRWRWLHLHRIRHLACYDLLSQPSHSIDKDRVSVGCYRVFLQRRDGVGQDHGVARGVDLAGNRGRVPLPELLSVIQRGRLLLLLPLPPVHVPELCPCRVADPMNGLRMLLVLNLMQPVLVIELLNRRFRCAPLVRSGIRRNGPTKDRINRSGVPRTYWKTKTIIGRTARLSDLPKLSRGRHFSVENL
jgi:hypothetical protein